MGGVNIIQVVAVALIGFLTSLVLYRIKAVDDKQQAMDNELKQKADRSELERVKEELSNRSAHEIERVESSVHTRASKETVNAIQAQVDFINRNKCSQCPSYQKNMR